MPVILFVLCRCKNYKKSLIRSLLELVNLQWIENSFGFVIRISLFFEINRWMRKIKMHGTKIQRYRSRSNQTQVLAFKDYRPINLNVDALGTSKYEAEMGGTEELFQVVLALNEDAVEDICCE